MPGKVAKQNLEIGVENARTESQKALLTKIYPYLKQHRHVVALGDAEYSNEPLISWLQSVHWDFVLHIKTNCLVRTTDDPAW